ncbi:MAG: hypothetical protein SFW08_13455 [Gemmatimonadaceae bacterium]|nr:hypothetical protein [Gemmatimonadaceae bacterium]
MSFLRISQRLTIAAAAAVIASVTGCVDNQAPLSPAASQEALSLTAQLRVSSLLAQPGERIAVSIDLSSMGRVDAQQGFVRYDASLLRYVGQDQQAGTWFVVNDKKAGELHVASMNVNGLPKSAGTMVFEVLGAGYTRGLGYTFEYGSTLRDGIVAEISSARVEDLTVGGTVPTGASKLDEMDHLLAAYELDKAEGRAGRKPGSANFVPGEYRLNLEYGDATLDGVVNITDAIVVVNAAVGLQELITGTNSPSRDFAIAGNPVPFNTGGPASPGTEPNGTRIINVTDATTIANGAILNNQPVVRTVIPGRGPLPTNRVLVTGNITSNTTWTANNIYELQGIVSVQGGAALTIEAGTRIEGNQVAGISALFVQRDGQIFANGTQERPIVMTCTGTKTKGCWGGLSIGGNAPINQTGLAVGNQLSPAIAGRATGGCLQSQQEGGGPFYGGCNPADNSGVLRYLIVEFGGFVLGTNNELNNITLSGVGYGTTVDYVQAHAGLDDGIELFGGTVDLKHIVMTDNSDDSFDYSQGWAGRAQFGIISMDPLDGDKGFEVDNTEAAATYDRASPWGTIGEVWNFTLIGSYAAPSGNQPADAMHLRRGTHTLQANLLVWNWARGLDIDDAATCTADPQGFSLVVRNSYFGRMFTAVGNADTGDPAGCGASESAFLVAQGNTLADTSNAAAHPFLGASAAASNALNRTLPDFRPAASFSNTGAAVPTAARDNVTANALVAYLATGDVPTGTTGNLTRPAGFFDATATYFGGVAPATASRNNIPWYSGWARGS